MLCLRYVTLYVFLWTPGRLAIAKASAHGDPIGILYRLKESDLRIPNIYSMVVTVALGSKMRIMQLQHSWCESGSCLSHPFVSLLIFTVSHSMLSPIRSKEKYEEKNSPFFLHTLNYACLRIYLMAKHYHAQQKVFS